MTGQKHMQLTKVLLQVGLTEVQSAVVRYQQQFRLTNKAKQKFLSSSIKQNQAAVSGWTL